MRKLVPLTMIAALASCMTAPPQAAAPDPRAQQRLAQLLGGKVAGAPQSCLPAYRQEDMIVIDANTIVFRDTPGRVWVTKTQGDCSLLVNGPYALVTNRIGGSGLCRGDIGQIVDVMGRTTVGTCIMGDFVPYTRAGS